MSSLISICVPACERPALVLEAVQSCLAQTYRDIEVVIGDDSRSDRVTDALGPLLAQHEQIRYFRNKQQLGQSGNVNRLFDVARGERLILLHDDDLLYLDAVEVLDRCWRENPGLLACYGKQYVISHSGQPMPSMTDDMDRRYYRTTNEAGLQRNKLRAALVEQMPPDGALLPVAVARSTRLRSYEEVGDDCDYDFILRLARQTGGFFFVDRYISQYRVTDRGISSDKKRDHTFRIVREIDLPSELEDTRRCLLQSRVSYAVFCHLLAGERLAALELIRNPEYWSGAALSRARVVSALRLFMPTSFLRALDGARRLVGRGLRRSDTIYRFIARIRAMR